MCQAGNLDFDSPMRRFDPSRPSQASPGLQPADSLSKKVRNLRAFARMEKSLGGVTRSKSIEFLSSSVDSFKTFVLRSLRAETGFDRDYGPTLALSQAYSLGLDVRNWEAHSETTARVPDIIDRLRRIAPVTAIRGNVDRGEWADAYQETECVELAGRSFYLVHDLKTPSDRSCRARVDVVVSGPSHVAHIQMRGRMLYLNPGSAGRRCFKLPITLATIDITDDGLRPIVHDLGSG